MKDASLIQEILRYGDPPPMVELDEVEAYLAGTMGSLDREEFEIYMAACPDVQQWVAIVAHERELEERELKSQPVSSALGKSDSGKAWGRNWLPLLALACVSVIAFVIFVVSRTSSGAPTPNLIANDSPVPSNPQIPETTPPIRLGPNGLNINPSPSPKKIAGQTPGPAAINSAPKESDVRRLSNGSNQVPSANQEKLASQKDLTPDAVFPTVIISPIRNAVRYEVEVKSDSLFRSAGSLAVQEGSDEKTLKMNVKFLRNTKITYRVITTLRDGTKITSFPSDLTVK